MRKIAGIDMQVFGTHSLAEAVFPGDKRFFVIAMLGVWRNSDPVTMTPETVFCFGPTIEQGHRKEA